MIMTRLRGRAVFVGQCSKCRFIYWRDAVQVLVWRLGYAGAMQEMKMRPLLGFANPEPLIVLAIFGITFAALIPPVGKYLHLNGGVLMLVTFLITVGIFAILAVAIRLPTWFRDRRR